MAKKIIGKVQMSPAENICHPLVSLLIRGAEIKGDTLTALARALGVSYERFTQWRRGEADIGNAKSSVHSSAARYIGVPPILVLALCRKFELSDFVVPSGNPIEDRLQSEITRVMEHKYFGGFVPRELIDAHDSIKVFVIFLIRQIEARTESQAHWLSVMQLMANERYESKSADKAAPAQLGGEGLFL